MTNPSYTAEGASTDNLATQGRRESRRIMYELSREA
jgi:hypothetical protein